MSSKSLLTIKQAAKRLNVSEITVKRYIKSDALTSIKVGGKRSVLEDSVQSLLNQKTTSQDTETKGVHFYWSQKNANIARNIYKEQVPPGSVIMDPFLGSGSSLFGIRNLPYKFVGVEINEHPIKIAQFNLQSLTNDQLDQLQTKLDTLQAKYGSVYQYQTPAGTQLTFAKALFNKSDARMQPLQVIATNEEGKTVTSDALPEMLEWYKNIYKKSQSQLKHCEDLKLHHNSRIALKAGTKVSDLFSPINFVILDKLKQEIRKDENFKFVLGSVLHLIKLTDKKSQSQFPYWIPSKEILDRNLFMQLQKKLNQLKVVKKVAPIPRVRNFAELEQLTSGCFLLNKPVQKLTTKDVPDKSVDFILTDPPYYDQVAYSEYLLLWQFFLGYKSNLTDEIVVSQRKINPKLEADYLKDLEKAFVRIHKTLKDEGQMWVYFKDSRPTKVAQFLALMGNAGFTLNGTQTVSTKTYTYKQNTSKDTTVGGDMIYKFSKATQAINGIKTDLQSMDIGELEHRIKTYAIEHSPFTLAELLHSDFMVQLYKGAQLKDIKKSRQIVNLLDQFCNYDKKTRTYSHDQAFKNQLVVGDALSVLKKLPSASMDACITDPPYNISGYDHKKKIGWLSSNSYWTDQKAYNKINEKWDKFSDSDYLDFTRDWLAEIKRIVKPNGNIAIFGSFHNIYKIGYLLEELDLKIINSIVWYKPNAFPNITQRMFCESTEQIIWAANGSKKKATNWTFNYAVMKEINGGKQMRNVFTFPTPSQVERKQGKHPSQKPVIVLDYLVKALTHKNDLIIDPFIGSGTTALAAYNNQRNYLGIDSEYEYIKLSEARLAAVESQQAHSID